MLGVHMCTSVLGMGGIAWFTRRVFRPTEKWAGLLLAVIVGGFGLATAACLWLAFIPPQAYLERIARLGAPSGPIASP